MMVSPDLLDLLVSLVREVRMAAQDQREIGVPSVPMVNLGFQACPDQQVMQVKLVLLALKVMLVVMVYLDMQVSQGLLAIQVHLVSEEHKVWLDKMDRGVAPDCQETQAHLDPQAYQVHLVALGSQEELVHLEILARMESVVHQEKGDLQDLMVFLGPKVHQEILVHEDLQVQLAKKVQPDQEDLLELMVFLEAQVNKAHKGLQGPQDLQALLEPEVNLDHKDVLEMREELVLRAHGEREVHLVKSVLVEMPGHLVHQVKQEHRDRQERQDNRVFLVNPVMMETLDDLVSLELMGRLVSPAPLERGVYKVC